MSVKRNPSSQRRVFALLAKEWHELKRSKTLLSTVLGLPMVMVAISVSMLMSAMAVEVSPQDAEEIGNLLGERGKQFTNPEDVLAIYMGEMGLMLILLLPAVVPSVLAANTIVREKLSRSLEALLVTPLRTHELVMAKVMFCAAMGVLPTYVAAALFYGVAATQLSATAMAVLAAAPWVVAVLLIGPLLGVLAIGLGIIVSARVTDVQTAQQLSGLLTLPVVGLMGVQATGLATLSLSAAFLTAAGLLVADVVVIALSVSLFERETVLTRWKS